MRQIQLIQRGGRAVALATDKDAIISDKVTGVERQLVAGMALYAIEIQAGKRPGPYTDADAEQHARRGLAYACARLTRRGHGTRRATP